VLRGWQPPQKGQRKPTKPLFCGFVGWSEAIPSYRKERPSPSNPYSELLGSLLWKDAIFLTASIIKVSGAFPLRFHTNLLSGSQHNRYLKNPKQTYKLCVEEALIW